MGGGGAPNDFSSVVKSKLQSYTRTGQACDRCKVRKIRCDALPEGCSHCINQNLECYVTDRVTGRTERRGYMQELEREKSDMMNHIRELEQLLGANGIEVKTFQGRASAVEPSHSPTGNYDRMGNMLSSSSCRSSGSMASGGGKENWQQMSNSVWVKANGQARAPKTQFTTGVSRSMLEARPADFHIGVTTDKAVSSSIKGTTLTILGSTIDVCSFDAEDMDEPAPGTQPRAALYNKSVQALMMSTCNINPPQHVDYPPRVDAFTYAEWYFLIMYPFLPILHKPTFTDLVSLETAPSPSLLHANLLTSSPGCMMMPASNPPSPRRLWCTWSSPVYIYRSGCGIGRIRNKSTSSTSSLTSIITTRSASSWI